VCVRGSSIWPMGTNPLGFAPIDGTIRNGLKRTIYFTALAGLDGLDLMKFGQVNVLEQLRDGRN
jgi:hypothetical protein